MSYAVTIALPVSMVVVDRSAFTPEGDQELMKALNGKHDGSIFNNLDRLFDGVVDDYIKQDESNILNKV
jgi:hypothetical protein